MPLDHVQHILVPVDFSDLSALGLRYAAHLAKCSSARLTALYADPFLPPPYFTHSDLGKLKEQAAESRRQAEAHLQRFVLSQAGPNGNVQTIVDEGLPADSIHRIAETSGASLIVMGSHGRSGVNRLLLGSVTERVLRETRTPTLIVRADWKASGIRNILCPVNDSPAARRAFDMAARLASCLGATLQAAHLKEAQAKDSIPDLCAWIPEAERSRCQITELDARADVAEEVIHLARDSQADLLVLGARHRRFVDTTVLGANTIRMLRHAPCAVLAVFDPADQI